MWQSSDQRPVLADKDLALLASQGKVSIGPLDFGQLYEACLASVILVKGRMKDPGLTFSDFTQNCEEAC